MKTLSIILKSATLNVVTMNVASFYHAHFMWTKVFVVHRFYCLECDNKKVHTKCSSSSPQLCL